MIKVNNPIPEPPNFDRECRQKGIRWLRLRNQIQISKIKRPEDYWKLFRPELRRGFQGRCGYYAMYIPVGTVDHFISWKTCKTSNPELAYEWSNFRFVDGALNSKKQNLDGQLLDPFEIQDEWFEIEIPTLVLKITPALTDPVLRRKAELTLEKLELDDGEIAIGMRAELYEPYRKGAVEIDFLYERAPLVARAIEKWQNAHIGQPLPDCSKLCGTDID